MFGLTCRVGAHISCYAHDTRLYPAYICLKGSGLHFRDDVSCFGLSWGSIAEHAISTDLLGWLVNQFHNSCTFWNGLSSVLYGMSSVLYGIYYVSVLFYQFRWDAAIVIMLTKLQSAAYILESHHFRCIDAIELCGVCDIKTTFRPSVTFSISCVRHIFCPILDCANQGIKF